MNERHFRREILEGLIADRPDDIDARLALASFYLDDGNPENALPLLYSILEMDPGNAEAYLVLGLCWGISLLDNIPPAEIWGLEIDEEEMLDKAVDYLEKAIELDPEMTAGYNALGRLLVIRGQEDEAKEMFKQSLNIDQAQHDVLEDLREITGRPVWELLDKETDMGDREFDDE